MEHRPFTRQHRPAAEASGGAASAARAEIDAGLRGHLLRTGTSAVAGHFIVAAVLAAVLWSRIPHPALVIWLGSVLGAAVVRVIVFRRTGSSMRTLRVSAILNAVAWGIGPLLIYPHAGLSDLLLVMVVLAGLVATGATTMTADSRGYLGYAVCMLVPLFIAVVRHGSTEIHLGAAIITILFCAVMFSVNRAARRELVGRLEAEASVRQSETGAAEQRAFLAALLESTPIGIATVDRLGIIINVNPAFEAMFGYPAAEAIGQSLNRLTVADADLEEALRLDVQVHEGHSLVVELPRRRKDGTEVLVRVSAAAAAEGAAAGAALLLYDDITAVRAAERSAREALEDARQAAERADHAKTGFLANMSHEIRTPLNGVLGMVEILLDGSLSPEQRDTAETIRDSGQHLLRVINDVLDLSKIEAGRVELEETEYHPRGIADAVLDLFEARAGQKRIGLAAVVGRHVPAVALGDGGRVRQILTNLVGNALKFTEEGRVTVEIDVRQGGDEPETICYMVRDTGIGVAAEKLDHIFGEFAQADASMTRRYGGTGLGLAISRRLALLMGGNLTVVSEPDLGSEFMLAIPLRRVQAAVRAETDSALSAVPVRPLRILLAEDNPVNQKVAATLLRRRGHHVEIVGNGRLAVEATRRETFDVVLMDVQMPELDGLAATREIREHPATATLPIVACTAHALQQEQDRCLASGMNGYLSKPFRPGDLYEVVERWAGAVASVG